MENIQDNVQQLLKQQTREWDLAAKNYKGLEKVQKHHFHFKNGARIGVQFNPERIYSSAAKVDAKSIRERKCFLCMPHLPEQQKWVEFGDQYVILVNPFPIFPRHLTIPHREHIEQAIQGRMHDMLELARELDDFVVFYNGPKCGASAPDHFHFQAGNKGFMPIEEEFEKLPRSLVLEHNQNQVWIPGNYLRNCVVLKGDDANQLCDWFDKLYTIMQDMTPDQQEPMLNILVSHQQDHWRVYIFPRKIHRPWQYFEEGEKQILLSPASVDMGGVFITPRQEDYEKMNSSDISDIFEQVSWDAKDFESLLERFVK